jgi:pimeloyl-ACP methyl ester carboxylesterase
MTRNRFENDFVELYYYKFGNGPNAMLCFHGYGMHGKQFKILEAGLGHKYTFYGFDLFFHQETKLKDQRLPTIKKGTSKQQLAALITDFCKYEGIGRFSLIGYSMGTHYATAIAEELAPLVKEYIAAAPSCLNPGRLALFFSKNKTGNKVLEKVALSQKLPVVLLKLLKRLYLIDSEAFKILQNEIGTPQMRFNLYACFTYLRFLDTNPSRLAAAIEGQNIKCIFIFGKRDKIFPYQKNNPVIAKLKTAEIIMLDAGHEMIKRDFATTLTGILS